MDDRNVMQHINKLAKEEHELFERESNGKATEADQVRLKQLATLLDQCWDLMRQRRAKREFGLNPNEAETRDEKMIKNYIG